MMALDIKIIFF